MLPISIVPFNKRLRNNLAMNRLQFSCANFKFFSHQFWYTLFVACVCWAEIDWAHFSTPEGVAEGDADASRLLMEQSSECGGQDNPRIRMFSTKEKIMYVWVLAIALGLGEHIMMVGRKRFWSFGSNRRESLVVVCFVISFILRLVAMSESNDTASGDDCSVSAVFRASVYATAVAAFVSCFRLLDVGAIHHSLGPLWVAVQVMMQDILQFSFLLGVTLLSFVVSFSILIQAHDTETGFESVSNSFFSLLWSLFEPFQGYDPRSSPHIYIIFLFFFLMMALVVLMNLLIAMLNYSYNKIKEEKDSAWKYIVSEIVYNYSCSPLFPPPLNLAVFLPTLFARYMHNNAEKKAGADIYDSVPRSYDAQNVTENEGRARKRRKIVLAFFRKRKREQMKEKMKRDMEEKDLAKFSATALEVFVERAAETNEEEEEGNVLT